MNASRPTPSKIKIFLIDDHDLMRTSLTQLIDGEPDLIVCGTADGGSDTIRAIDTCRPDLVVMDTSLQGGQGMKLLEKLKTCWPERPVLVLSLHDNATYVARVMEAGASRHISKNSPGDVIVQCIRAIRPSRS